MVDDSTKLMLGPILALLPLLLWELAIKPSRTRRNLALLLIAELELNLEEIAYYQVCARRMRRISWPIYFSHGPVFSPRKRCSANYPRHTYVT